MNPKIGKSFFWKLLERFGVQGIQFILQIILARLLSPEHYGVLSLMIIFTSLANVFIQTGFNTALIQNKDVTEEDYSSVFWVSLAVAAVMYGLIWLGAPLIADFYAMPDIVAPLRVLALMLFPGTLNSIQLAKVSREMDFKKVFYSSIGGILIAGIAGIAVAMLGGGLWALVIQNILNITVACMVMLFTVRWRPRLVCRLGRVIALFSFGWKLLASALLDTLYQNLSSLVVGKKYSSETLGFYNRGQQFPQFIITAVNGSVQSVMLPAMSAKQDDPEQVKGLMRGAVMMSAYIIFPMMAGLAAVAEPLITIVLTEKWLPCVPYMQIFCFSFALWPVHTSNLQAINAMGRSDIFLKLEIIKKIYGIAILAVSVFCFDSPMAIAWSTVVSGIVSWGINAAPNKKLIHYSYKEQLIDLVPSMILTGGMFAIVLLVGMIRMNVFLKLVCQILAGIGAYLLLSAIARPAPYNMLMSQIRKIIGKN